MYSLERVFYGVAAAFSLLALVLFGLFFDLGDMVLAAFRAPRMGEGLEARRIRAARRLGLPDEVLPDASKGRIGWSPDDPHGLRELSGRARLFARPRTNLDDRLEKAKLFLAQQGFTHKPFIEMEALYRVDRGHNAELYGVERLMARGNHVEALDRIEQLIARVEPRNKRAVEELLMLKLQIAAQLQAPPEELYEVIMQRLELLEEIVELEEAGYNGVPRYKERLARVRQRRQALRTQIQRLRDHRSEAYASLASGTAFGKLPPEVARVVKAAARKDAQAGKLSSGQAQRYIDWVDTRTHGGPAAP